MGSRKLRSSSLENCRWACTLPAPIQCGVDVDADYDNCEDDDDEDDNGDDGDDEPSLSRISTASRTLTASAFRGICRTPKFQMTLRRSCFGP